jgi:HAD superfamily hydrolase (TIGR01509 family)
MTIKALIFDFDGLILDTETPEFGVWQAIYREYGQHLAPETWGQIVGGLGVSQFDPAEHLVGLVEDGLTVDELRDRFKIESEALVLAQPVLPGVMETLNGARQRGLRLAIASSSPHSWVDAHLTRLGLFERFEAVICADDVPPGRTKPNPDLFLKAAEALQVNTREALAFEDSPNGVRAARAAGIFVVLVPNPMTALLEHDGADLALGSLADKSLRELLIEVDSTFA